MPSEEQLSKIRDGLAEAEQANETFREELRLAEKAGVDTVAHLETFKDTKAKLLRIKKAYGL